MDAGQLFLNAVEDFIHPTQFNQFKSMFWALHKQPRIEDWNEGAVSLLENLRSDENLSKRFCRYLLSLGFILSDELYFHTNACELLPFPDYLQVLTWTSRFLREMEHCDESDKGRLWIQILEKIWRHEVLKRWLVRLSQVIFRHSLEKYEMFAEMRSSTDSQIFQILLCVKNDYEGRKKIFDEMSKAIYLRSVVDRHLESNLYLMNRFLVSLTGGEMFIPPQQRTFMLSGEAMFKPSGGTYATTRRDVPTLSGGTYATARRNVFILPKGTHALPLSNEHCGSTSSGEKDHNESDYSCTAKEISQKNERIN